MRYLRLVCFLLMAALVTGLCAGSAKAATASVTGSTVRYIADSGEANNTTVTLFGSTTLVIREFGAATITAGAGCTAADPKEVSCDSGSPSVDVSAGDMNDRVVVDGLIATLIHGGAGDDTLVATDTGSDELDGDAGNDTLEAGTGNDTLNGGSGDDSMTGGCSGFCAGREGDDTFAGGTGTDAVSYAGRAEPVTVTLDDVANDGNAGEQDNVASDVENVTGGDGADTLTGDGDPNVLNGGVCGVAACPGDTIAGQGGDDVLIGGGNSVDQAGADTLLGGSGNDELSDDRGVTHFDGGSGDDALFASYLGNPSGSTFAGGSGIDTVDFSRLSSGITLTLDDLPDDGPPAANENVHSDVENAIGTNQADSLTGSSVDNRFDGLLGADAMHGGDGTDTVDYSARAAPIGVSLDGQPNDGAGGEGDNVFADVDHVKGGSGNDRLSGADGPQTLDGGAGDDVLTGGKGADSLNGGPGTDLVDYSERTSGVAVSLDGGPNDGNSDDGSPGARDNAAADVEGIEGGSGADTLTGNNSDNRFVGGADGDVFNGLGGVDTADYSGRVDRLSIALDGAANDGAAGEGDNVGPSGDIENVTAGAGDDVLVGSGAANSLSGGGGDDVLDGGFGADVLSGGDGFDTGDYSARAAGVSVSLGGGADDGNADDGLPGARDDVRSDVEALVGGDGQDTLTGDGSDNAFDGGPGADQINGGGGEDLVDYSSRTSDLDVSLDGVPNDGDGTDGLAAARDNVAVDVEDIVGGTGSDTLTGSGSDNYLFGGEGADRIDGREGSDELQGDLGNDSITSADTSEDLDVCGDGTDSVHADDMDDIAVDCENITQTSGNAPSPSAPPQKPAAPTAPTAGRASLQLLSNKATVNLKTGTGSARSRCDNVAADECVVSLVIEVRSGRGRTALTKRRLKVGTVRGTLAGQATGKLKIKLNRKGLALLKRARGHLLHVTATGRSGNRAGVATALTHRLTLRGRALKRAKT
jgi:Ca2+-binding RTX toxin-like protein